MKAIEKFKPGDRVQHSTTKKRGTVLVPTGGKGVYIRLDGSKAAFGKRVKCDEWEKVK